MASLYEKQRERALAEAQAVKDAAISAGSWPGKNGSNTEKKASTTTVIEPEKTEEKKTVIPEASEPKEEKKQIQVQEEPEVLEEPDSQTKAEEAKKKLEDYLQSEERKQSAKERAEKQRQDMIAQQLLYGLDGQVPAMEPDRQEEALRAEADYWDNKVKQEADEKLFAANMQEIQNLSGAERTAFENYANNRTFVDPENLEAYKRLKERYGDKLNDLKYTYQRDKEEKAAREMAEKTAAKMDQGGALADTGRNVLSIVANLVGGITGTAGRINEMVNGTGPYQTAAKYTYGDVPSVYGKTVRDKTSEQILAGQDLNISDGISGRELGAIAYQGGMGALDTGARLLASGGNPFIAASMAASQTFSSTVQEATEKGATPQEAYALATVSAGIEALTEKLPLDNLVSIAKGGANPKLIVNLLLQAGVEIGEEEASLIGTTLAEMAILKEKSGYQQSIQKAAAMGVPYEQAVAEADRALLEEAKQTALISGFSGFLSAGGAEAGNRLLGGNQSQQQTAQQPQTVQQEPTAEVPNKEQGAQKQEPENWMENGFREAMGKPKEQNLQEDSTAVNTDPSQHTPQEQAVIDDYQNTVDDNLVEYVEAVKNNPGQKMPRYPLKDVSDRAASDIQRLTGIDVSGNKIQIEARTVEHILKRHGENGNADHSMRDVNDIGRIQYVIDNYDSMENGGTTGAYRYQDESGKQVHSQTVLIKKKVNGTYFVVEAVPDTKKKTLYVLSAYMNKNGQKETAPSLVGDAEAYRFTSETKAKSGTVPANSIPQNGMEVNGNLGSTQQTDTFGQSTEGGQVKGTGAAEADFSGKPAYNATLSGDNAQADRATDVRPMELPRQDVNGGNISAVTGNVYGAGVTPDEFASLMEEPTARGDFSYIPISNNEATQQATENISRYGWQDAYIRWHDDVRAGRAGAELSARGALFLNHAAQAGDRQQWLNVLSDFQQLGTNTAQGLQAFRILRNLAPSDRLYMMRRSVDQMVEDMHLRVPVRINQQLAEQYQNAATDEEANAILDEIITDVAAQIPSTAAERWTALRYVNMLGNFRTQARNVSGNIGAKVTYLAKDQIGAALEKIAHAANPNFQRTKSNWVSSELKTLGREDFDEVRDIVLENGRFDDARRNDSTYFAREVNNRRQIFRTRFMESYRRLTNWAMNNDMFGDAGFARSAYARAFGGYLKANGFTGNTLEGIDQNLLDNARLYAIQQAQESTFRDHNAVSDWISRIGRREDTPRAARMLSEGIMPFRSTPANVLVRAEEYSPLGIINTAVTAARAANPNSEVTGTDVVESLAKTLTGAGIFALGAYLGKMGMLTGGPDPDEEKEQFDTMNGQQNYALQLPNGRNITIDFLSPVAVPMFLGAEFAKIITDGGYDLADYEKVFTSLADPLIQMSMLQGLNDTLDDIKYSENNIGQFLLNASMSYLTQGLTNTLAGQIEKSTEKNRQTTYVDKDSDTPEWIQRQLGKAFQKVPGIDYQQTDYVNVFGEKEEQRTDALGWINNLFSPGYIKKEKQDDVTKELYRLDETGVEGNVFPDTPSSTLTWTDKTGTVHKDEHLTQEQYQTLAQTQGETAKRILDDLVKSGAYQAMTDQQKADIIDRVYEYAAHVGKTAALEGYDGGESWMKDLSQEQETDAIIKKSIEGSFGGAFDDLTDDWNRGNDPAGSIAALDKAYTAYEALPYKERLAFLEENSGRVKYYITSRNLGMDTETFTGLYQTFRDIEGKDKDTAQKAQEWSYTLEKAVDKGIITERQKTNLRENMQFRYSFAAETAKFDAMIEAGVSTNLADVVIKTLADLKGTGKNGNVQEIDKRRAIAGLAADDATIDAIMHEYMADYDPTAASVQTTEIKYDYIRQELGMSAQDYVDAYAINLKGGKWKDQKKAIARKLGCSEDTAYELVLIFEGRKKDQLISWYEMQ